jgi:hypothetical protein
MRYSKTERSLDSGEWFHITSPEQHKILQEYGSLDPENYSFARIQIGNYNGPGKYMLIQYKQRCPRNCCYDDVNEVLTAQDVAYEIKKEIIRLAEILKEAKQNQYLSCTKDEH